jgi:hypothetical protein
MFILKKLNAHKSKILGIVIFIFTVFLFCHQAFAATYYISSTHSNRNDSNEGTNPNYPWEHIPFATNATSYAASYVPNPGDNIYLKRGDTWILSGYTNKAYLYNGLWIAKGGRDGKPVTLGAYGSGNKPKIIAGGSVSNVIGIGSSSSSEDPSYFVVENLDVDCADQANGITIIVGPGDNNNDISNIVIQNNEIHNTDGAGGWRVGIHLKSMESNASISNCLIFNNEIYDMLNHGISLYSNTHLGDGSDFGPLNDNIVRGNVIHNSNVGVNPQYAVQLTRWGDGNIVEYNTVYGAWASGGICLEGGGTNSGQTNAKIRYNLIRDITSNVAALWVQNQGNPNSGDFYGNIVLNCNGRAFEQGSLTGHVTIRIDNNTFFNNCKVTGSNEIHIGDSNLTVTSLRNNIIYSDKQSFYQGNGTLIAHSNNIMYRITGANDSVASAGGSSYNRSNYQDWEPSGYSIFPNFKNVSNLPETFSGYFGNNLEPNNDGLSIESGTAIDNGFLLPYPYNSSINSVLRPNGESFDIGAYERRNEPDSTSPQSPQNFRIIGQLLKN